ncbi:aminopeptidase N [Rubrivivax albus]|nr:aminopeptidase N [Rubrivivax albus]
MADPSHPDGDASPDTAVRLHRREAWQPWDHELERVELAFELDAECTVVTASLQLHRRSGADQAAPLVLSGRELTLLSVMLDGRELSDGQVAVGDRTLTVHGLPERFELCLRTRLEPVRNLSGRGLFVLGGTLVTQMEPEGLSRVTYFPDRPDVLARYRVTLTADAARYPVLLSNGDCTERRELPDGRHQVVWDDPFRKPSYVFGLVAGDLAAIRDTCRFPSGREVRLAVYAPVGHIRHCRFALEAVRRAMLWDEATYGLECDVNDYSLVALPGFPGAMENKGLNLYDLAGVLADTEITTDDEALTIERIIAHEYFHNWTGNRVTCRDWFQLSLKEGLTRFRDQTYIDDRLGGAYRIDTVRALLRNQFPEDDGPNRHPIRPERYADVEELYTATVYEKGAEVIRMMHTLLGPARFTAGVRDYLARHDGQAVTTDEFVDAMARAGGRDLAAFRRWYVQAGRPRVHVERQAQDGGIALTLTQTLAVAPDALPLTIPVRVSWFDRSGQALSPQLADGGDPALIEIAAAATRVVYADLPPDAVPSLFEGLSAPVGIEPHLDSDERLVLLAHATDPWARWNAAQGLMTDAIRAQAAAARDGASLSFADFPIQAFARLLDEAQEAPDSRLVLAELLRVPDEPVLSDGQPFIDVDGHHAARTALRASLGQALRPQLLRAVQDLGEPGDGELMHVGGLGRRRLAAVCLDLLAAVGDDEVARLCHERVLAAPTMTERFDALACLVDIEHPLRQSALDAFIDRWRDHPTVVAKWFTAQALARSPGAIERIMALQIHPLFDPQNMALGLALLGSFFRQNRVAFHDAQGRGYEWLADVLLMLDRLGRPGAVWLTPQISQWRRHLPERQAAMRRALERVAGTAGLSNGTRGLVMRFLDE